MTIHQDAFGASQGSPNLEALQYLQENWGRDEIASAGRYSKVTVASGTSEVTADIPVGAEIIDAVVICTRSSGSGTMTVKDGNDNAVTDDIACATDKSKTRASQIDDAYNIVTTDGIKVVANDQADAGIVYIEYLK